MVLLSILTGCRYTYIYSYIYFLFFSFSGADEEISDPLLRETYSHFDAIADHLDNFLNGETYTVSHKNITVEIYQFKGNISTVSMFTLLETTGYMCHPYSYMCFEKVNFSIKTQLVRALI